MTEDDTIIFKDKKQKQKILKQMRKQFMSNPYFWNLNQKYKDSNMGKLIKRIQEVKTTTMTLANNYHSAIIQQISVCRYPNLIFLNLSNNNISNLQGLSLMGLDKLEHLYLSQY